MSLLHSITKLIARPFRKRNDTFDDEDFNDLDGAQQDSEDEEVSEEKPSHPFLRIPFRPSSIEEPEAPIQEADYSPSDSAPAEFITQVGTEKEKESFMQKLDGLSRPKKLMILGGLGVMTVSGMVIGVTMFRSPQNAPIAGKEVQQERPAGQQQKEKQLAMQPVGGTLMTNPFVDEKEITEHAAQTAANGGNGLPGVGVNRSFNPGGNASSGLPAIPNVPRPNLPSGYSIPSPQIPSNPNVPSSTTVSSPQASVQGVVTSSDGNNMAIMSDGTVLSKGESYKDGRIAYIGGDGIQFENGNTMKFNN